MSAPPENTRKLIINGGGLSVKSWTDLDLENDSLEKQGPYWEIPNVETLD
jgi:hypothetical protein